MNINFTKTFIFGVEMIAVGFVVKMVMMAMGGISKVSEVLP